MASKKKLRKRIERLKEECAYLEERLDMIDRYRLENLQALYDCLEREKELMDKNGQESEWEHTLDFTARPTKDNDVWWADKGESYWPGH